MGIITDWIYRIRQWFKNVQERNNLLNEFNSSSKEAFTSGTVPTYLKAKTSRGDKNFRHQYSQFYSGFRIVVMGGQNLTKNELIEVGRVILDDNSLVRKLVIYGFDTLEIHGESDTSGAKWRLKDYIELK
jgi:hypothetical protein